MTTVASDTLLGRAMGAATRVSEVALSISGIVMALMAFHVVADVGMRYLAGFPLAGTTEIVSRYYMVTLIFLPLAFVQLSDRHICASLISDLLVPRYRILLDCLTSLLMAVFGILLAWRSAAEALRATVISEKIQTAAYFLPTWPSRWIPVLAMTLIAVLSILSLIVQIVRFASHGIPDDEGGDHDAGKVPPL